MRRWLWILLAPIVVVIGAGAAFFFWPAGLEDVSADRARLPKDEAVVVQRGEYLARAADCAACHTLASGRPYAGGLPFRLPFGTIYATNITPDKDTGIGGWSDAEFVRALHHGIGRDGRDLYPAFPYTSYALMSTEDALAIKDYLFAQEPVHAETPRDDLQFPYDQRYLMRAWKLLFLPRHEYEPDPQRPAAWNRGAYLVEAMGHCGECHTPRDRLFALDRDRKFAGAVTAGWKAYNISSAKGAGIGDWSDEQIVDYLGKGYAHDRGPASGSMAEAVAYSLRYLTPEDLRAMVAYLRTVPPQDSAPGEAVNPGPPAVKASTELSPPSDEANAASLGLHVFQGACASCHAWDGEGLQHPQAALVGSQTVNDPSGTNLLQVLIHGSHLRTGEGDVFMPPFGAAYTDVELASVANYVIGHFGAKRSSLTPTDVAAARKLD